MQYNTSLLKMAGKDPKNMALKLTCTALNIYYAEELTIAEAQ
jgi:hypothetical protein